MFFEAFKEALAAFFLGALQGVTEFLPISSTAHLGIVSQLIGGDIGIYATNIISLGTTVALIQYFWKDIVDFVKNWRQITLWVQIILATIPIALVTLVFKDAIESQFRTLFFFGVFLIAGALLLMAAEYWHHKRATNNTRLMLQDYFALGLFQALALFPGMSRSGSTLAGGLFLAKDRAVVIRASFWISVPAFLLAGAFSIRELLIQAQQPALLNSVATLTNLSWFSLFLGGISAYFVGLQALKWLIPYLQKQSSTIFIVYRIVLGLVLIVFAFFR